MNNSEFHELIKRLWLVDGELAISLLLLMDKSDLNEWERTIIETTELPKYPDIININGYTMNPNDIFITANVLRYTNGNITKLDIQGYTMSPNDIFIIANVLQYTNSSITKLEIRNYDIGTEGAKALTNALTNNFTIKELTLFRCNLGQIGGSYIGSLLRFNRLTSLSLLNNNMGKEAVMNILNYLSHNNSLTKLYITDDFDDECAIKIAQYLKFDGQLIRLGLMNNKMTDVGIIEIFKALTNNITLEEIDLAGNNVTSTALNTIISLIAINKGLNIINLDIPNTEQNRRIMLNGYSILRYNKYIMTFNFGTAYYNFSKELSNHMLVNIDNYRIRERSTLHKIASEYIPKNSIQNYYGYTLL
jgi:Ran GTPase-activating protein (RanGAP) involved in mRNA processing and transport